MYEAIKDIGDYNVGDIVPDELAKAWLEMYAVPQVRKVDEKKKKEEKATGEETAGKEEPVSKSSETILEDYLAGNQSVVKKNVSEDNLNKNQLETLLRLEKDGKKRPLVLNAIKQRLKKL